MTYVNDFGVSCAWRGVFAGLALAGLLGCEGTQREFPRGTGASTSDGDVVEDNAQGPANASGRNGDGTGGSSESSSVVTQLQPANGATGEASTDDATSAPCADGSTESCGPPREEGICRFGTRSCAGGSWGECVGAVFPGARDCSSNEDNDCDGQPDDALDQVCRCPAQGSQTCEDQDGLDGRGQCRAGQQACVLGEGNVTSDWGPCVGAVGPGAADSCSVAGDDTNCDGVPNGGCSCVEGAMVPCGPDTDAGICQRGVSTCRNGAFGACEGAVFPGRRDCSSAQDNDCDGRPDNTPDAACACTIGSVQECATHPGRDGIGPCRAGSQTCVAGNQGATSNFGTCTGAIGPAQRDACTVFGDDADCNGAPNSGCQCVAGRGNQPCAGDPNNSRCNAQGQCAPCQSNADCSLVSGGRNLCAGGVCGAARCGDGVVQPERGEECDDAGTVAGDGCTPDCRVAHAPVGASAFGGSHVCMINPSGEVTCWGTNGAGELGIGRTDPGILGATGVFGISDATQMALGPESTCVVRRSGRVACWGLGFSPTPTDVSALTGISQVAVAATQVCVIRSSRVSCAVRDPGAPYGAFADMGLDAVTQISAGNGQVCALRSDGSLRCWGSNNAGQLGTGQTSNPSPTPLLSQATGVAEVSAGGEATCVRLTTGNSQCFGAGPLGSRTAPTFSAVPQQVVNLPDPVRFASMTNNRCALLADQSVRCWGDPPLGDADGLPIAIALPGRAVEIGAGSEVACAVLEDLSVYCWGNALFLLGLAPSPAGAQVPVQLPVR